MKGHWANADYSKCISGILRSFKGSVNHMLYAVSQICEKDVDEAIVKPFEEVLNSWYLHVVNDTEKFPYKL